MKAESLFSESGYIFDDRRLGTSPDHIEQLMFLKQNHHLWDLQFVAKNVVNGNLHLEPIDSDDGDSEISEES